MNKKVLLAALVFAIGTAIAVFAYIDNIKTAGEKVEYVNVVVAAKTIEKNVVIASGDLKTEKITKEYANPRALTNPSEILGKKTNERIIEGEQVLADRIASEQKIGLSYEVPEGKRAVSINVNEAQAVANFLRPGDFVDVLATFDSFEVDAGGIKTTYQKSTRIILQNVLVLGIGQLMEIPENTKPELPKTITLAVTAEEAEKLVYSEESGILRLALRRAGDHAAASTQGAIRQDVITPRSKQTD